MASTKIVDLINRAMTITQDTTSVRWPQQEWLDWYNDAVLAVLNARPDAAVNNEIFAVDEVDTKQTLPAEALRLITITRNTVSGKPIRIIPRNYLDDQLPNWHSIQANDVEHFIYDERDPKHFYVFPRPTQTDHFIEIVYSIAPSKVVINDFSTDTTVIGIDDTYVNALLDFMLYRAYSKDADYAENAQRAQSHLQAFSTMLGLISQSDQAMSPSVRNSTNG